MNTLVTGAGGFIGGHLVKRLLAEGHDVRAVDCKEPDEWDQLHPDAHNVVLDLQRLDNCQEAMTGCEQVYNLAADMGGMGFIESHKTDCMLSVLISTHMLQAAAEAKVERFFYSSSACVYAADKQRQTDLTFGLTESHAYPAMPEDGYGWEKLFSERMARHFSEDRGLVTRVARYHNVYGPNGTFTGGREKAPAAVCRKVALARLTGGQNIEIWGDGQQTRSFMYVEDCIDGTRRIMDSDIDFPINLGSHELVSINQLVDIVEEIAGVSLERTYRLDAPLGVRGRNSDNTTIKAELGWEPSIPLRIGLERTFAWIHDQMRAEISHAYA